MIDREPQVDVIALLERQLEDSEASRPADAAQGGIERVAVAASNHEPQIESVLALVVVIDARLGVDQGRHLVEP